MKIIAVYLLGGSKPRYVSVFNFDQQLVLMDHDRNSALLFDDDKAEDAQNKIRTMVAGYIANGIPKMYGVFKSVTGVLLEDQITEDAHG